MAVISAGILMYRERSPGLQVLLVHPGGPFWRHRDVGSWSIPKGVRRVDEDPEATARREFAEELGLAPDGMLHPLGSSRQRCGKRVEAFALAGDLDVVGLTSNMFEAEWPPGSGRIARFPEVDRAAWFPVALAREKILSGQRVFLDRLEAHLADARSA